MKKKFLLLPFLFGAIILNCQNKIDKSFNGKYYTLEAEKGVDNKPSKIKYVELGENNGKKMLAVAACEKCMPAIFSYKPDESKIYKRSIFFNYFGLYAIAYDEESFIIIQVSNKLGAGVWSKFAFSNFYSKSKTKVDAMTKQKLEDFARKLSEKNK